MARGPAGGLRQAASLMAHAGWSPEPGEPLETGAQLSPPLLLCHCASALKPSFVAAWQPVEVDGGEETPTELPKALCAREEMCGELK